MAVLCSCRQITTTDVRAAASTCLSVCQSKDSGPCLRSLMKRELVDQKGAPNCKGCAPTVNRVVDEVALDLA